MTQQELLEKISDLESLAFHLCARSQEEDTKEAFKAIHSEIKEIWIAYAEMTGCHN